MMDEALLNRYQPVIGLEVHAQLLTQSKIYNSDSATYGGEPNTHVGVISLGHPGTLPKLNKKVVEQTIKIGLACHCEISRYQIFDRKNYFYPDLPKGYQITQDKTPICKGGYIKVNTTLQKGIEIRLNRIHIEEDAGKSIHKEGEEDTLIDLNRAGVPLIEIVTEPVIKSAEEAGALLSEIRKLVRYLEICDGNMEEGSLRCDANVSVMEKGENTLGKKVEVKNMNSIRNVQRAIDFEIERQINLLEKDESIVSETRTFDMDSGSTSAMRTKEELNDYRYFPDPDLSPLEVSEEWINQVKASMPAMPGELFTKFVNEYSLPEYDAEVLTESRDVANYFQEVCRHTNHYKAASNWIMGPIKSYLNENNKSISEFSITGKTLSMLIALVEAGQVSFGNGAQKLLPVLVNRPKADPYSIAKELNLIQDSDENAIESLIDEILKSFPTKVKEYRQGKKGIISMFMGEVMKKSKGKADPKVASGLLQKKLSEI